MREKTKISEFTFPDGFHRPASARYGVEIFGKADTPLQRTVDEKYLQRDRNTFTKAAIRSFLKPAVKRATWIGAPWIVDEQLAHQYRLETTVPAHLAQKGARKDDTALAAEKRQQEELAAAESQPVPKALVEDLNLPATLKPRPSVRRETSVESNHVHLLLETWAFFNVFLEVLNLDSFTLDDFCDALQDQEPCELIDELFCSILNSILEDPTLTKQFLPVADESTDPDSTEDTPDPGEETNTISTGSVDPTVAIQVSPEHEVSDGLLEATKDWQELLRSGDLSPESFPIILIGILLTLESDKISTGSRPILLYFDAVTTKDDLVMRFRKSSADIKLQLMGCLIDLLWQSSTVRHYIDECMENLTQLRKERADATKARKVLTDAVYQLRVKMRTHFPRLQTSSAEATKGQKPAANDHDLFSDPELDEPEEKTAVNGIRSSLPKKRQSRGLVADDERDDSSVATETHRVFNSRDDYEAEIAIIKRRVVRADDKVAKIDEEFRESDAQRLRKLGQDRFYNSYWFLESCGMPVFGLPNCSTSHALYATGRIYVQGPSVYALEELRQRKELHEYDYFQRRLDEEGETVLGPEEWGYYDDADQVNALLDWLATGQRETALRAAIEARAEVIAQSMDHRTLYLTGEQLPERRSKRHNLGPSADIPRHQVWRNTLARKHLGGPHSRRRTPKGVAVKKKSKR